MGYFDGLAASSFKTNKEGQVIFYPWGKMGKGHIVPTEEKQAQLRQLVKLQYMVAFPLILVVQIALGWQYSLVLLPVLSVWYYFSVKKHLKDLPKTDEKITVKESVASSVKAYDNVTLWILLIASLFFVLCGIVFLIFLEEEWVLATMMTAIFVACSAIFAYMIKQKNK